MTDRDRQRLVGVHPRLTAALGLVFDQMATAGAPMFVVKGVRTQAEQVALYAQGRTTPGKIVTMKDGVTHPSDHQPRADGLGYAVDSAFIGPDPFDEGHPWQEYGEAVESQSLIWGGRWSHPHDAPHAELDDLIQSTETS